MLYSLAIDLLPSFFTNADLYALLLIFPSVVRGRIITNAEGKSVGTAIIEVKGSGAAERIVATLDGEKIRGYPIRISRLGSKW